MTERGPYVLGVDGGNSKTAVAIVDAGGNVVGSARGGGSDIYATRSVAAAVETIAVAATAALEAAGLGAGDLAAAVFSLAGADWPEDIAVLERELSARLQLPVRPLVVNDAIGGLWSGTARGEGIAVVVGTFNAVGARNRDGRVFHCGFWPDRTGGFDLGTEALKAVYREGLGLGPSTALTRLALDMFAVADPIDLMHAFTRRESPVPPWDVQRMTPVLLDCALAGDEVARAIVHEAGGWLGEEGRVCAERVGLPTQGTVVVLTGGVMRHPASTLRDAILEGLPGAVPVQTDAPPLVGSLRCGLVALGCDPDVLARDALADVFT